MNDPIRSGLAGGWRHLDASLLTRNLTTLEADVVIVGSGAGGGVTADLLSAAGLRVVLVEEGPLRSSADFKMREADAYPELYQESAARKTSDKAINILQGRCVGGSTTVNWKVQGPLSSPLVLTLASVPLKTGPRPSAR